MQQGTDYFVNDYLLQWNKPIRILIKRHLKRLSFIW